MIVSITVEAVRATRSHSCFRHDRRALRSL